MSNITNNSSNILVNYPVPGADNSSQGFRDNFANIKDAFAITASEITWLQTHALLNAAVPINLNDAPVAKINDLNLSTIINGSHNKFYGNCKTPAVIDSTNFDVSLYDGVYQTFSITHKTSAITIRFKDWPTTEKYASVRVQLTGTSELEDSIVLVTANAGILIKDASWPSFTISNDAYHIIEAWSANGGQTVFVSYIGRFDR